MAQASSVVIDMVSSSLLVPDEETPDADGQLICAEDFAKACCAALTEAHGQEPFEIMARRKQGTNSLAIAYRARVAELRTSQFRKKHTEAVVELTWPNSPGASTRITVAFGTDGRKHWMVVRGNGTTAMSGQNVWPVARAYKRPETSLCLLIMWPYLTLFAVCKAVTPRLQIPKRVLKAVRNGQVACQNFQAAIYLPLRAHDDSANLTTVVEAIFKAHRVSKHEGGRPRGVDLGHMLGITVSRYEVTDAGGNEQPPTLLMTRKSGKHEVASVCLYDKAALQQLRGRTTEAALDELQRVDITLKRALDPMITEAVKLAKLRDKVLELDRDDREQPLRNVANIVRCICFFEAEFSEKLRGRVHRGFRGWLMTRVLFEEFHLDELLGFSTRRHGRLRRYLRRWAKRDPRYKRAFDAWADSNGIGAPLRQYLKLEGLSDEAVTRRLRELKRMGFSGKVPPHLFNLLRVNAMMWGASDAEFEELVERIEKRKCLVRQLDRYRPRANAFFRQAHRMLRGYRDIPSLAVSPIRAAITDARG